MKRVLLVSIILLASLCSAQINNPGTGSGGAANQTNPQFTWFVDPVNGNDSNACNVYTAPCKTANAVAGKGGYSSGNPVGLLENGLWTEMAPVVSGLIPYYRSSALALTSCAGVTTWLDSSGNALPIVSANNGGPVYNLATISGLPAVLFTGNSASTPAGLCTGTATKASLNLPSGMSVNTNSVSIFVIGENLSQDPTGTIVQLGASNTLTVLTNYNFFGDLNIHSSGSNLSSASQAPSTVEPLLTGITVSGSSAKVWTEDVGVQVGTPGVTSATVIGGYMGYSPYFDGFSDPFALNANIYEVLIYNRALTQTEITLLKQYRQRHYGTAFNNNGSVFVAAVGDSLTLQPPGLVSSSRGWVTQAKQINPTYKIMNFGHGGLQCNGLDDPSGFYSTSYGVNVLTVQCGTNDLLNSVNAATIASRIATYVAAQRSAATTASVTLKVITATILPCTGCNDTVRKAANALLLANPSLIYGDIISNQGADPDIGITGANTNALYFNPDGIHPNALGESIVANKYYLKNLLTAALPNSTTQVAAGVPIIVSTSVSTAQTSSISSTNLLASVPTNASYQVIAPMDCISGTGTVTMTNNWTDTSNTAQSSSLGSALTCGTLGSGSQGFLSPAFNALAGTSITFTTTVVGTVSYDLRIVLLQYTTI